MKKFISWIQKYLVVASPVVLTMVVWSFFQSDSEIRAMNVPLITGLWEVMSWSLILWFACFVTFMVLLVFRKETQEATVKLIAGMKERDEREEVIMGLAARRSFVATTALTLFLLFASCLTLSVARLPDQTIDGKKSSLSIGFHFSGSDTGSHPSSDGKVTFEHHDLPISKTGILLMVLVWQLCSFRMSARKELREA